MATSDSSHSRFEVAPDQYQRAWNSIKAINWWAICIGRLPDCGTHLKAGAEQVYSAQISQYELPTKNSEWLDKSLLSAQNIEQIRATTTCCKNSRGNGTSAIRLMKRLICCWIGEKAQKLAVRSARYRCYRWRINPCRKRRSVWEVKAGEKPGVIGFPRRRIAITSVATTSNPCSVGKADFEKITAIQRDNLIVKNPNAGING